MRANSYLARRISETMRCPRPVETPDTDAATIYEQRWRRRDGSTFRVFDVLALDAEMAEELGGIRLRDKYRQSILDWCLVSSRPIERLTARLYAVLSAEDPDESQLRTERFQDRETAEGASA